MLHFCEDKHLALLDSAEDYPHGYDRIAVQVLADRDERRAVTYVGMPSFLDGDCRPTQRYLSHLLEGATAAGLEPEYIESLRCHPVHQKIPVSRFVPPPGEYPLFTAATLARHPLLTALAGCVFDMSSSRWHHGFLRSILGRKDTTLFHLGQLESSDGSESLDDIKHARLSPAQQKHLDEYLHVYASEYDYVGRFRYD